MHSIKQNAIDASWAVRNDNTGRDDLRIKSDGTWNFSRVPGPVFFDDFLGDVIADEFGTVAGTDSDAEVAAVSAAASGIVRLTTGNDTAATLAANGTQLHSALNWKANQGNLVFETRLLLSAVTNVALFVGLTDQIAALEMPLGASGSSNTITASANDAVGFVFDTATTADNIYAVGVKATTVTTPTNTGIAPVLAVNNVFRIEVDASGNAKFFLDNVLVATIANCVTATVALTPVIAAFARGTSARNVDVDYIFVQADRA